MNKHKHHKEWSTLQHSLPSPALCVRPYSYRKQGNQVPYLLLKGNFGAGQQDAYNIGYFITEIFFMIGEWMDGWMDGWISCVCTYSLVWNVRNNSLHFHCSGGVNKKGLINNHCLIPFYSYINNIWPDMPTFSGFFLICIINQTYM